MRMDHLDQRLKKLIKFFLFITYLRTIILDIFIMSEHNYIDSKTPDINETEENISMEISPAKQVTFEDQQNFEKEVEERVEKKVIIESPEIKEKSENEKTKNQEKPTFLTLENLLNIKTIIEVAVQRNSFKPEEMKDVLGNYEHFVKGLQTLINSQQK